MKVHTPSKEKETHFVCLDPPKKTIAMQGKTGIQLIGLLFAILIVGIFLFPFLVGQNTKPIIFNLQTEDPDSSSIIPEYGAVFDIVSTSDGGSVFLAFLKTPEIDRGIESPGIERIALIKIDINGTVLWSVLFQDLVMFDPFYDTWVGPFVYYWGFLYGDDGDKPNNIEPTNLIQTSDNGFLFSSRFKTNPNDMCLIKVGNNGDLLWTKNYQMQPNQGGCTIVDLIEANEGGYAFILETETMNWLVKTDNNGVIQWYKSFEEIGDDGKLITLIQTAENGYCLLGKSDIYHDDEYHLPGFKPKAALYNEINLIKTDEKGNLKWLKNVDRTVIPSSSMVIKQTENEEFILSGYFIDEKTLGLMKLSTNGEQVIWENSFLLDTSIYQYKNKYTAEFSNSLLTIEGDVLLLTKQFLVDGTHLVSFTNGGVKKWEKSYEGLFPFIDNTQDTNFLMGGVCNLTTCVMKINTTGSLIWKRIYHPPNDTEIVIHVLSTTDGGFMLYGITNSFGAGKYDLWLLKTNSYGDLEWQKTFGSEYDDYPISILESKDGGYFFVGQTEVKTVGEESGSIFFGKLTNRGDLSWNLTIDFSNGTGDQAITFIKQTTDEGYIIGGTSLSNIEDEDYCHSWIIKLKKHGFIQWKKDFSASFPPFQTHDDGFIIIKQDIITNISKFDNSGDRQWEKAFNFSVYKLISTPNAYFLLFVHEYNEYENSWEMAKLNLHGEKEWQVNLGKDFKGYIHWQYFREVDDGYLVWSLHSPDVTIIKYDLQGNEKWEKNFDSYFINFNNSDSHLLCCENYVFAKISRDGIQEWNTHTLLTPIDDEESRWTELSNGNIVILREDYDNSFRDLHIMTKTETIPCTPDFINISSATLVRTIVATSDGGCVVAGGIITNDRPSRDIYLLKLSNNGLVEWIQTYAGIENQIKGFLIQGNFTITPSSTPTPGWGPISLLVAAVVLTTWSKRHKGLE
ncbi:MAG: hypothetical protein ACFFAU_20825 [Candidatus Hodarchaeota archaeon]